MPSVLNKQKDIALDPVITIAIVDDHKLFRETISYELSKHDDIRVLWKAEGGREMIDKIAIKAPHILLMDIRMPGMDGDEAIRIVKNEYPAIKVIVLTIYDDPKMKNIMMNAGAAAYLTKLSSIADIYHCVRKYGG